MNRLGSKHAVLGATPAGLSCAAVTFVRNLIYVFAIPDNDEQSGHLDMAGRLRSHSSLMSMRFP